MWNFAIGSTKDKRYVFLFAGGPCHAAVSGSSEKDEIKSCYKQKEFADLQLLPQYLIKLISKWYQKIKQYIYKKETM